MQRRPKRRGSGSIRQEHRARHTTSGAKPDSPPLFETIAWLLEPARREDLRRRLIDGMAGALEPVLWRVAYSGPGEPEGDPVRWITTEQLWREMAAETVRNGGGRQNEKAAKRRSAPSGATGGMASTNWKSLALEVRRMARELVEDPEYQAALRRRLADGKAPRMMPFLLQWPDQKARDPQEQPRRKPRLTVASKYLPWDPRADPMREKTQRMNEAKARREEEARAQQAARDKPATATPEEPSDPDQLEVYQDPPGRVPYDPDR